MPSHPDGPPRPFRRGRHVVAGGKVLTDFPSSAEEEAADIAVQADGKYVVAGRVGSKDYLTDAAFGLVRYNPDGRLDPTFGDGGKVLLGFDREAGAESVAITPDGKIVALGYTGLGVGSRGALVRLNPNGSLDPTFDGDGRRIMEVGGSGSPNSVAVQADGKLLLAGGSSLVRLNTDGSLDPTFDGDGILNSPGSLITVSAVSLDGDRLLLAGTLASNKFAVARFTPTGAPDASFSGDGVAVANFGAVPGYGSAPAYASAVAVTPDGRIVATGTAFERVAGTVITDRAIAGVARFNADGSADTTFASDGTTLFRDPTYDVYGSALLPAADGSVTVACQDGSSYRGVFGGAPTLFRLNQPGALDPSFGGGFVQVAPGGPAFGPSLVPGPQGSVVVATASPTPGELQKRLLRRALYRLRHA